jgi:hypothetical protein
MKSNRKAPPNGILCIPLILASAATAAQPVPITNAGLVGHPLVIRLLSKGLSTGEEVAFDDVQLNVTLLDPVAIPGGPYNVPNAGSLSLNGSASLPSDGQSITTWEWDLDNDGDYDESITGATPATITYANLQSTHGMTIGANTIKLRVTDDSSPTPKSATATGTVTLAPPLGCQLGVLNLAANGGINPNTGNPWQPAFTTHPTSIKTETRPSMPTRSTARTSPPGATSMART